MTLAKALQDKLQSWKEAISFCTVAEPDEKSRKDESSVSASCSLFVWVFCVYFKRFLTKNNEKGIMH